MNSVEAKNNLASPVFRATGLHTVATVPHKPGIRCNKS